MYLSDFDGIFPHFCHEATRAYGASMPVPTGLGNQFLMVWVRWVIDTDYVGAMSYTHNRGKSL
jgi:hypothetical protein